MTKTATPQKQILVITGSYERLLYGLALDMPSGKMTPQWVFPAHISCIKTLSVSSRFLASGSSDEHIKLYDLKMRKEVGTLNHHTGTITSLQFFKRSHLLTSSEDGTIGLLRCSDWELLKTLKGHVGTVHSIAVHPSGKVLLSVGVDLTLKTWDLTREGVMSLSTVLPSKCLKVVWAPSGTHFCLLFDKGFEVHDLEKGIVGTYTSATRLSALAITSSSKILTSGQTPTLNLHTMDATLIKSWPSMHTNRIKDVAVVSIDGVEYGVSCSSDGGIKVWDLENSTEVGAYESEVRLTCVGAVVLKD